MYYKMDGELFRELQSDGDIMWAISLDMPSTPKAFPLAECDIERVIPANDNAAPVSAKRMATGEKRLKTIMPLIIDDKCISNAAYCKTVLDSLAQQCDVSARTLKKWYYDYLAYGMRGLYPAAKNSSVDLTKWQKDCRWGINKYYYSSKRLTLQQAYKMMLYAKYVDENGTLLSDFPKFHQFKYYYYTHENIVKRAISQDGLSKYKREIRPIYGSVQKRTPNIGTYEMDETVADIFLRSDDRQRIIGRPHIFLTTDCASRMIVGLYVGFDSDEEAVIKCLNNAVREKAKYCTSFGIPDALWPACGIPVRIITDGGRAYTSSRVQDLCEEYGMICEKVEPFRGDQKGIVEKSFDLLQNSYKFLLKRKGVIETDYQERGAVDYRREATLTLYEFTQVVIRSVLLYNNSHVQVGYERSEEMIKNDVALTATAIWQWNTEHNVSHIMPIDGTPLLSFLPRGNAYFTRFGLDFNGLTYRNEDYHTRCVKAGKRGRECVVVAYDELNTSIIYLFENGQYMPFTITQASSGFGELCIYDAQNRKRSEQRIKRVAKEAYLQDEIQYIAQVKEIVEKAENNNES